MLLVKYQTGGAVLPTVTVTPKPMTISQMKSLSPQEFKKLPPKDQYTVQMDNYKTWQTSYRNPDKYSRQLTPEELATWAKSNANATAYTGVPQKMYTEVNPDGTPNFNSYFPVYGRPSAPTAPATPVPNKGAVISPPASAPVVPKQYFYLDPYTSQPLDPDVYGRPEGAITNVRVGQYLDMAALKAKMTKAKMAKTKIPTPSQRKGGILRLPNNTKAVMQNGKILYKDCNCDK